MRGFGTARLAFVCDQRLEAAGLSGDERFESRLAPTDWRSAKDKAAANSVKRALS